MTFAHAHAHPAGGNAILWIVALPFALAAGAYLSAAATEHHRGRSWPWTRSMLWMLGCTVALAGTLGPLLSAAFAGMVGHVVAHLLVGMVAPLLLVLAAPITLALRALEVVPARRLSRILRSGPVRLVTLPPVAAALNVGSMWLLYFTPLWELAQVPFFHLVLMVHFLVMGVLFTASIAAVDPDPHRWSVGARSVVLVVALAAHGVMSKVLYADPLLGVGRGDAELGAQVMYYGGDLVDLALMVLLGAEWYRESGRRLHAGKRGRRRPAPRIALPRISLRAARIEEGRS